MTHTKFTTEPVVIDTPVGIRIAQLLTVRSAIRIEQHTGMKHSKLGSVKVLWAKHYGMKPRAKFEDVIARLEVELRELGWTPAPAKLP